MRRQYAWRSNLLAGVLAFVALSILAQMVRIQTSKEAAIFKEQRKTYTSELRTFYPERGEIYDRNIKPLGLERGINALWNKGGLMYAPPMR